MWLWIILLRSQSTLYIQEIQCLRILHTCPSQSYNDPLTILHTCPSYSYNKPLTILHTHTSQFYTHASHHPTHMLLTILHTCPSQSHTRAPHPCCPSHEGLQKIQWVAFRSDQLHSEALLCRVIYKGGHWKALFHWACLHGKGRKATPLVLYHCITL